MDEIPGWLIVSAVLFAMLLGFVIRPSGIHSPPAPSPTPSEVRHP